MPRSAGVVKRSRDGPRRRRLQTACDREQAFRLPPDVRDWLPEGHFAWFVVDAVAQMDLAAFCGAYRQDGHGRAAFDPAMMVALLLYAYARGTLVVARDRARV